MIRSPLRPEGQQQHQPQQQQQQQERLPGASEASPIGRRLSAAAASSSSHNEMAPCATACSSVGDANVISDNTATISVIGREMLQQLEADCEQAARWARQRAEEFARFIDEQLGKHRQDAAPLLNSKGRLERQHSSLLETITG